MYVVCCLCVVDRCSLFVVRWWFVVDCVVLCVLLLFVVSLFVVRCSLFFLIFLSCFLFQVSLFLLFVVCCSRFDVGWLLFVCFVWCLLCVVRCSLFRVCYY